jgi:hypothetical protein
MNDQGINADLDLALEQQLTTYFSLYKAESVFKANLEKQLALHASQQPEEGSTKRKMKLLTDIISQPSLRWAAGILLLIILLLSLITIQPVRAAIELLLDVGYIDGAGFVKVSETHLLNGPTYSIKPDQTMVIDQVIAGPKNTLVWLHATGREFSPDITFGDNSSYLEVNGERLQVNSWGWENDRQKGTLVFDPFPIAESMSVILHLAPDWIIPIRLVPMDQMTTSQSTTIYLDICQTHLGAELCLRAFVSDSTGYHLWLSGSSENPILYLQNLETRNPLTGEEAILMDPSGYQLAPAYPEQPPIPNIVALFESLDFPKEVRATLSFERSANESGSLELLISGLSGKTPANETIVCQLGENPQIGDHFPCEKSFTIAGEQIRSHEGEITQHRDGIHLTLLSDPIQASNGLLVTFVDAESLYYENSSLLGTGFSPSTNQLEIWLGLDSLNAESKFAIRITAADLTILKPFRLSWSLNP